MYRTILLHLDPVLHLKLALLADAQGRSVEQLAIAALTAYEEAEPASCIPCREEASDMTLLAPLPLDSATRVAPVVPGPRPAGQRPKKKRKGPRRNR